MARRRSARRGDSVADMERALEDIVRWAIRNDVHGASMQRARVDLPRGHAGLLARLNQAGPLRLGDLARALGVDSSTVTPQTQRLERSGFLARTRDPRDGRAVLLSVTRAGRALLESMHLTRRALLAERLTGWSDDERAQAAEVLKRVAQDLNPRRDMA
jgi:DNA-binding MarR family transcriptional regulator